MTDNFVFSHDLRPGYATFYTGGAVTVGPQTFHSALRQSVDMYFTWCGRFMGNMMVYLLFMLPHMLYCVLATLIFCLYILVLQICIFGCEWRKNLSPGWIFGLAALLWLGMPSFGESFFWLCVGGQIPLMAQALMLLPFRLALEPGDAASPASGWLYGIYCCLFLLAGVATCSLDYPTSAALPVTALACLIWLWLTGAKTGRKIPVFLICGTIGLFLGAALTLLAPGNRQRMLLTTDPTVHAWMANNWGERILSWLSNLPGAVLLQWLPLLWLAYGCWLLYRQHGRDWLKTLPPAAGLFFLPCLLTHGAWLFTAWPPDRAFATTTVQLLVCAAIVWVAARKKAMPRVLKHFRYLTILFSIICAISITWEGFRFVKLYDNTQMREKILLDAKDGVARLPRLPIMDSSHLVLGGPLADISQDPAYWVNRAMALHYGVKEVIRSDDLGNCQIKFPQSALNEDARFANLRASVNQGRLYLQVPEPDKPHFTARLSFYYHGRPGILGYMPNFFAEPIYKWLTAKSDWRIKLVPLFMAREDIPIEISHKNTAIMVTDPLNLDASSHLWLVHPGASRYSTDLLPLECVRKTNPG